MGQGSAWPAYWFDEAVRMAYARLAFHSRK